MSAKDANEPNPAPPATPEVPDRVDAYLSRKAQQRLDPRAVVLERADGTWYLTVSGRDSVKLGDSFGGAKEALRVLIAAEGARKQK
jgi:hypothetical protein